MDTYNPTKLTAKPIKSDLTLRQLADFDESGGDRNRVDNVRNNQVLVSLSNINRPKTFSFRYISDILLGGSGITIATDKDGITSITNTGVTKIIAGSNITISPVGGTGNVTVNAASGGITSLNLLTAAAQTFVNDTNVSIVSSGTTHTLTWLGTLADSRIASASVWNAKEPAIAAGTTSQYWRGDKTWQTFPTIPTVGTWGALNYPTWVSGTPFVKMTAAGTFALDTNTYLTGITSGQVTTALGYTPVTNARTISTTAPLTGGGDLSANRTLSMPKATTLVDGYLSATDWTTFNSKQAALVSGTNIKTINSTSLLGSGNITLPTYLIQLTDVAPSPLANGYLFWNADSGYWETFQLDYKQNTLVSGTNIKTVNSNSLLGAGNVSVGTVTSVSALTLGTTGTDLSSTVATGTTTPVITLNVPTASSANRGALSAADWTTFNTKGCAMAGNLNGGTIAIGTTYIGISVGTTNTTEAARRAAVVGGTVTYLYLRTSGIMTGSMAVTLMKNGVATAMTFTIAAAAAANIYTTTANQFTVVDGDELSIRIVQTTAISIGITSYGFIIK
jgi:hypothetical protein